MAYVRFLGRRECTRSLSVTCYSVGFCRSTQIIASENYGALWAHQHTCYGYGLCYSASGVRVGKSGVHDVEGGLERPRTPGGDRGGSPGPTTALSVTCLLIDRWGRWVAGSTNSLSSLSSRTATVPPLQFTVGHSFSSKQRLHLYFEKGG